MFINFKLYPGLRLLIISFMGVIAGYLFNINYIILSLILVLSLLGLFIDKFRLITYYVIALCFGIWFTYQLNELSMRTPDKIYQEFPALIQGTIVKTIKVNNTRATVIVQGDFDGQPLPHLNNQRILLTIYGMKYKHMKLKTGMKVFADVKARTPLKSQLPTDFPENHYAASLDVKWITSATSRNVAIINPPSGFLYMREKRVNSIQERIIELFPKSSAPVVTALLTGDKTKLSYETKQLFSLSGTAHVLAVSGLHVGIIATIIFFLLGFVRNNWLKFIIFTLMIAGFVLLTGMQASALRAGLMAILFVYAKTLQRHTNPINIVAIAILLILIIYPEMLFSAGFQMSVSAIIGIFLMFLPIIKFFKIFVKSKNIFINFIITSLAITLSASIIVTPLVAYYFKVYSIVSPLANLLVIPLMTLGMCFSIIAILVSYIYIPVASIYALSADFLLNLSGTINQWAVELPSAYLTGDSLVFPAVIISLGLIYITLSDTIRKTIFRICFSIIVIIVFLPLTSQKPDNNYLIYPREQYVAIDLPLNNNQKRIIIIDRKPAQKPKPDFAMLKYIETVIDRKIEKPIEIFYSGNAGLSIVDRLKGNQSIKFIEMDIPFQKTIQNILHSEEPIPQIINLSL